MVYCSIKDAYGENWKTKENYYTPPSQPYKFNASDPYFDSNKYYGAYETGVSDRIKELEQKLDRVENFYAGDSSNDTSNDEPSVAQPKGISLNKGQRIENILYYVLLIIFAAQIMEGFL